MFGYITVNEEELKIKDARRYRGFYCGICRDLGQRTGQSSRLCLTYDMTFLAILLTSLYEEKTADSLHLCPVHPGRKQLFLQNSFTAYAADMNVMLSYHNLMDDWLDEKRRRSLAKAWMIRRAYRKTAAKYPRQEKAIRRYLKALHKVEKSGSADLDLAAGLTGTLMAEIYVCREDAWSEELRQIGFYMGKFIYLMDACEDVEKDRKTGNYNPFRLAADREDFSVYAGRILSMMIGEACRAFERLPILENVDILRNIMYSGVWQKFNSLHAQEKDNTTENESL